MMGAKKRNAAAASLLLLALLMPASFAFDFLSCSMPGTSCSALGSAECCYSQQVGGTIFAVECVNAPPLRCLSDQGGFCRSDSNCNSQYTAQTCNLAYNKCYQSASCVADGGTASSYGNGCCSGYSAYGTYNWLCKPCGAAGDSCTYNDDCCSGTCTGSHTCAPYSIAGTACTIGTTSNPHGSCSVYPARYCIQDEGADSTACQSCVPAGNAAPCTHDSQCCAGSHCDASLHACAANPPPPSPQQPTISGTLYPNTGTAICTGCQSTPPAYPYGTVYLEYAWFKNGANPAPWLAYAQLQPFNCASCALGDQISLHARVCAGPSLCSPEVSSNTLTVQLLPTAGVPAISAVGGGALYRIGQAECTNCNFAAPSLLHYEYRWNYNGAWQASLPQYDCAQMNCVPNSGIYAQSRICDSLGVCGQPTSSPTLVVENMPPANPVLSSSMPLLSLDSLKLGKSVKCINCPQAEPTSQSSPGYSTDPDLHPVAGGQIKLQYAWLINDELYGTWGDFPSPISPFFQICQPAGGYCSPQAGYSSCCNTLTCSSHICSSGGNFQQRSISRISFGVENFGETFFSSRKLSQHEFFGAVLTGTSTPFSPSFACSLGVCNVGDEVQLGVRACDFGSACSEGLYSDKITVVCSDGGEGCTQDSDCCAEGSVCSQSAQVCIPPVPAPETPIIQPDVTSPVPHLYTSGYAQCTQNCPQQSLPPFANAEYLWHRNGVSVGNWDSQYSIFNCAVQSCFPGDTIHLKTRICVLGVCGPEAQSSTLVVEALANNPPTQPLTPQISPASLKTNGLVACPLNMFNCGGVSGLPGVSDPEGNPITAELRWFNHENDAPLSAWLPVSATQSHIYNCLSNGCTPGQQIKLQTRACDQNPPGSGGCTYSQFSNIATVACSNANEYCAAEGDCCEAEPALECVLSQNKCFEGISAPPAPQISPESVPFYANGKAKCTINCNLPSGLPSDYGMQYLWTVDSNPVGSWSGTYSDLNCGCSAGDKIRLKARICSSVSGLCSPESESLPLSVQYPPPPTVQPLEICKTENFTYVMLLCAFAGLSVAILVALAYMGGEALSNARLLVWAKSEVAQLFASLAIVAVILFVLISSCQIQIGELRAIFGIPFPQAFSSAPTLNLYESSISYLESLQVSGLANLAALRYKAGAYEIRSSFTRYECDQICYYSMSSTNVAEFGGESANLAIVSNLISVATLSQFGILFQYFTILFIYNGLFMEFLPIAIVIRSIPLMRQLGGALMAIFIALYLLYPLMVAADGFMLTGLARNAGSPVLDLRADSFPASDCSAATRVFGELSVNNHVYNYVECVDEGKNELDLKSVKISKDAMDELDPDNVGIPDSIKMNVLIFLAAVFLPALNFVVIAAFGRELSRLLGEETDISRLGQMV